MIRPKKKLPCQNAKLSIFKKRIVSLIEASTEKIHYMYSKNIGISLYCQLINKGQEYTDIRLLQIFHSLQILKKMSPLKNDSRCTSPNLPNLIIWRSTVLKKTNSPKSIVSRQSRLFASSSGNRDYSRVVYKAACLLVHS